MLKITNDETRKNSELIPHLEYIRDFCKSKDNAEYLHPCNACEIKNSCFKHVDTFESSMLGSLEEFCENAIKEIKNENFDKHELERELSFGKALLKLNDGKKLSRADWFDENVYVFLEKPAGKLTKPYLVLKTTDDEFVVWIASQDDILSNDWFVTNEG